MVSSCVLTPNVPLIRYVCCLYHWRKVCYAHIWTGGAVRCLLRMYRRARLRKLEDHVMIILDDADAQVGCCQQTLKDP